MFATKEHIKTITGYKQTQKQAEALKKMGFRFIINDLGNIVIPVDEIKKRFYIETDKAITQPNFKAIV